jgi:hypothetical protein
MRGLAKLVLGLALTAVGCATDPPPPPKHAVTPPPVQDNRVKLAVLPVESDSYPRAARAINDLLRNVHVRGVDDYFVSKVGLEVVQLSIECVEQSDSCYAAVGKSLMSQRLLLAQIAPMGTRRRDKGLRVTFTLFDVETGSAVNVVDHTYKNENDALGGLSELLERAVSGSPSARAAK